MATEQERIEKLAAADLLASAELASGSIMSADGSNRYFFLAYVLLGSTVLSFRDITSAMASLGIASLFIPLAVAQYLIMRKRVKARRLLDESAIYGCQGLLVLIAATCLRAWTAVDAGTIGAKWIITFFVLWQLLSASERALNKYRVRDAQERAE